MMGIFFSNSRAIRNIIAVDKSSIHYLISCFPLFVASNILSVNMLYFEIVSTIMHDVSTRSAPQNIRELFIHSSDVHVYNTRFSCADNIFVQKSRLHMKLKSFPAFGTRLWNCLHPVWRKLTKRAFKRKIRKLLLTVLEIEDYYVKRVSMG